MTTYPIIVWAMVPYRGDKDKDAELPASKSSRNSRRRRSPSRPGVRLVLASVCVLVWAADNIRGVFDAGYTAHVSAGVPLAAAAYLFGTVIFNSRQEED